MSQLLQPPAEAPAAAPSDREALLRAMPDEKTRRLVETLDPERHDLAQLFPKTEGWGAGRDMKRRVRTLASLQDRLDVLLYPTERIEFVTAGILNSFAEQYFLGWLSLVINRTLFVFTNYRVILIAANQSDEAKKMMWQIPYGQVASFSSDGGLSPRVEFKLADGTRFKYVYVPRADRQRLGEYVQSHVDRVRAEGFQFPHYQGRDPLCPACATPVPKGVAGCSECREPFVEPPTVAVLSAVLPGLGDLYMGHRLMAVFELLGMAAVWLFIVLLVAQEGFVVVPFVAIFLACVHGWDAFITWYLARKGVKLRRDAWKSD